MGENQEKIETLEQSKQAEQDPTRSKAGKGSTPNSQPLQRKGQQDEPPIDRGGTRSWRSSWSASARCTPQWQR